MNIPLGAARRLPILSLIVTALLLSSRITPAGGTVHRPSLLALIHEATDSDSLSASLGAARQSDPTQTIQAEEQFQRAFPRAGVPPKGYPLGIRAAQDVVGPRSPVVWRDLGPAFTPNSNFANPETGTRTSSSGRATALAVVPSTCSNGACGTIYLGTADGGLWKTTDAGLTWKSLLDHAITQAIGAITLDPKNPDMIYVGTGEPNHSGDSERGIGVLRSTDGGTTWTNLGYRDFVNSAIASLIVDPRTAGTTQATLYAVNTRAVAGRGSIGFGINNPYLPALGFYSSKDGGKTWQLSSPPGAGDGAQSLVMDPSNPDVLYAGFNPFVSAHAAGTDYSAFGIYRSTDDGRTWTHVTKGLPAANFDTVTLAIAPSDPQMIYAAYNLTSDSSFSLNGFGDTSREGMYRSTDGGTSWTTLSGAPDLCAGQCAYDMPLAVDPTDPNVVYAGGTANYGYYNGTGTECASLYPLAGPCHASLAKSTDGGNAWADVSENGGNGPLHPDNHAILVAPNDRNVIYTANDGGIFHSPDGGKTWEDLNRGIGTLQFNGLAVASNGTIYAGTQDNGTFKYTGSTTWTHIEGGDGGPTAVDPRNPNLVYKSLFGPLLLRNDAGGDPSKDVFIAPFLSDLLVKGQGQSYEPYTLAPSRPGTIFYGTYRIWRSNLRGGIDGNNDGDVTNDSSDKNDWVPISFDLRCSAQPLDPTAICKRNLQQGRGIASVAVSQVNPNVVAAAASNGHIWLTTKALSRVKTDSSCSTLHNITGYALCDYVSGVKWHRIDFGLPQRYPSSIAFAPGSSTRLYVTLSGFDKNTPGHRGHVFESDNAGRTWRDINGKGSRTSLPDLPFSSIVVNPNNGHLYVAADYGVFASLNHGRSWERIDQRLPAAPVYQMTYNRRKHALVVATHGRGIWQTSAP